MNWNKPVADDDFALASGLRLDSRSAVLSRYSKPAPVALAASRIAPVTRDAASVVAPLIRPAISIAASIVAPWGVQARASRLRRKGSGGKPIPFRRLAPSGLMVNGGLRR